MSDLIQEQQPPKDSTGDVWKMVLFDMEERRLMGIEKYGKPVQPFNGRDPLIDAYQEALDLCVYLRQAIEERKTTKGNRIETILKEAFSKEENAVRFRGNHFDQWFNLLLRRLQSELAS